MSFDVQKNWLYQLRGRNIHLYQIVDSGNTDTLGDYKIRLPDDYRGKSLIYPSEAITAGLRFDGTAYIETFVSNDPNELNGSANPTLTSVSIASGTAIGNDIGEEEIEAAHINLSRLLTLAVIDYLKAMLSESTGNVQLKDYYMKEFWRKVGDDQSNRRRISMTFPTSPFALR